MKLKIIIFAIVLIAFLGCKNQTDSSHSKTEIVPSEKASGALVDWIDAINNNDSTAIEKMYDSKAITVVSEDTIIDRSSQIANHYSIQNNKITSIESLFKVVANKDRQIHYELIRYMTESLKEYVQIVIWRLEDEKVIREFEFTEASSSEAVKVDTNEIAARRKLWMELCNANNAENLVKQLYSPNTIYFNHKPIVSGTEDLIKEYDYMNNDTYNLQLHPLKLEVVNANVAFEIGQCSGSYQGKYILVWKKQFDEHWKIYMDSNI